MSKVLQGKFKCSHGGNHIVFVGISKGGYPENFAFQVVLAACTETVTVVETKEVQSTEIVEVVPTPVPSTRKGGWLDMIVIIEEPSADAAISRMEAGDIQAYFYTVARADILKTVQESENLAYQRSYGSYNEFTFNPVGPTFEATGKLNPFSSAKVREAMNWLIDRNYIANEVTQGMAVGRLFAFSPYFAEASRYADLVAQWETFYSYNKDKATEVITAEMEAMGATKGADGKWMFNDEPVNIVLLIRTEDERRQIGDYVANELESIGFTCDRQYKPSAEASPIWTGNPNDGLWHIYTGGWVTTVVPRTEEDNFIDFYAPDGWPGNPLWDAYTNDPVYYEAAMKLYYREYTTLEERRELFAQVMPGSLLESQRVWTSNRASFTPYLKTVSVTGDLAGGVYTTPMWALTLRYVDQEGGAMTVAMPSILTNPWNPTNGSNWAYDMSVIRATQAYGTFSDPWTGLAVPQRIEKAEVTVQADLPIGASPASADWLTFTTADVIEVPGDAWIDWNPETETFITVAEAAFTETLTAAVKSVVYYPDLSEVKWHDGTPVSLADMIMQYVLIFDRGSEVSDVYDPAAATTLKNFKNTFKGMRIVSENPIVIEYYTDNWQPDAENNVVSLWPNYGYGTGSWYSMAVGLKAEASGETAFSQAKAGEIEKEWLSYLSGPTIDILKAQLEIAVTENYIPYVATLGKWVTPESATTAWANYAEWVRQRGHFWIGTGPYFIERAFPVEGMVVLKHFADFPDMADRWSGYGVPKVAVVDVTAPASMTIGKEATFDVDITFEGEAYPADAIDSVNWLLFAADGSLAAQGAAEAAGDGLYTVKVSADDAAKLTAGSSKLLVVVVSNIVSIPSFGSAEFPVTAP